MDGKHVDTVGPMGDLQAISIETRKPAGRSNIWKDFGGGADLPRWDLTEPADLRRSAIVAPQTPEVGVVAYDKLTGSVRWKSAALSGIPGYVTPSVVKVAGEDQLVMITAAAGRGRNAKGGSVNGLDLRSGKVIWTYAEWQCIIPVPQTVDAGEGRVLITGAYGAGSAMIKVEKKGDGTYGVSELFKNPDFGAHTQPPVLHDGHFYSHYTINGAQRRARRHEHGWPDQVEDRSAAAVRPRRLDSRRRADVDDGRQHEAVPHRAESRRLQAACERRHSRARRQLGATGSRGRQAARPGPEGTEGAAGRAVSIHVTSAHQHRGAHVHSQRVSMPRRSVILIGVTLVGVLGTATGAAAQGLKDVQAADTPLVLKAQGSFFVGGEKAEQTQVETGGLGPGGHITVNQMYVRYMVPQAGAGNVPVVMVHGATLTGKSWETTPDGRMGWDEYFVRKGHPVYVPDQVGRGRSGFNRPSSNNARAGTVPPASLPNWLRFSDEVVWPNFRFGSKPDAPYADSQFPVAAVDELSKQGVPDLTYGGGVPNPNPTFKALSDFATQLNGAVLIGTLAGGPVPAGGGAAQSRRGKGPRPDRTGSLSGGLHGRADQDAGGDPRAGSSSGTTATRRPAFDAALVEAVVRRLPAAHRSPEGGRRSGRDARPGGARHQGQQPHDHAGQEPPADRRPDPEVDR